MTSVARAVANVVSTAVLVAGLYVGSATAVAEVHVNADNAVRGGEAVLTFRVASKSDTRVLTTQVSVALPDVASAMTELMPGWTARLDREPATGTVRAVTWTAVPGVGIAAGQFGLFRVAVTLPNTPKLSFPVTQTYSDGTQVRWDQPPLPGADVEHPTPTLTLASGPPIRSDHTTPTPAAATPPAAAGVPAPSRATPDIVARGLVGAGLLVVAIATVVWLTTRRRI
jgi:uncharacterized protein YcnI